MSGLASISIGSWVIPLTITVFAFVWADEFSLAAVLCAWLVWTALQ